MQHIPSHRKRCRKEIKPGTLLMNTSFRGLVVRVLSSGSCGFGDHTGQGSLLKLMQFHLPQFAPVHSSANEYQHCWEGTCDGQASGPGESVQLHSNLLALNENRLKHWLSLASVGLGHTVWGDACTLFYHFPLNETVENCRCSEQA